MRICTILSSVNPHSTEPFFMWWHGPHCHSFLLMPHCLSPLTLSPNVELQPATVITHNCRLPGSTAGLPRSTQLPAKPWAGNDFHHLCSSQLALWFDTGQIYWKAREAAVSEKLDISWDFTGAYKHSFCGSTMSLYKREREQQFVQCIIALEFHMFYESNMLGGFMFLLLQQCILSVWGMK